MAIIVTTEKQTYTGGVLEISSQIVGYALSKNRVVRFTFATDNIGASHVSWFLENNYLATTNAPSLRWYMGTDPASHVNAGASTATYCGEVTATTNEGVTKLSGDADIVLLPNTAYYLWIFPSTANHGYYNLTELQQARVTPSGGAGLVFIDNGSTLEAYQAFIDNGTGLDLCLPYIDDGSKFNLHT